MASLTDILITLREDIIVNRILPVVPSHVLSSKFTPHGDPQDFDDAGLLEDTTSIDRLFDVFIQEVSVLDMSGSDTQDYTASLIIKMNYPRTIKGSIASVADTEGIKCYLNKNDNLPEGVHFYASGDRTEVDTDDGMIVELPVTVIITADKEVSL